MISTQSVFSELPRHEIALGDLEFLTLGVPGEIDRFEAVEQWSRNVLDEVRGRDEQDLRQIERHAEIVVGKRVILRRVEHFEQRRGGISLEGDAELIDLIEQEDRVFCARLLHALDDAARHRPHVRAPVAANIGLVTRAAE